MVLLLCRIPWRIKCSNCITRVYLISRDLQNVALQNVAMWHFYLVWSGTLVHSLKSWVRGKKRTMLSSQARENDDWISEPTASNQIDSAACDLTSWLVRALDFIWKPLIADSEIGFSFTPYFSPGFSFINGYYFCEFPGSSLAERIECHKRVTQFRNLRNSRICGNRVAGCNRPMVF